MASGLAVVAAAVLPRPSMDELSPTRDPNGDRFQPIAEDVAAEVLAACQLETSTCTDSRQDEGRVVTFRGDGSGLPGHDRRRVTGSYHATVTLAPPFTDPSQVTDVELWETDYPDWERTGQSTVHREIGWHKVDETQTWIITRQISGPDIERGSCTWLSNGIDEQTADDFATQLPRIWHRMVPAPGEPFGQRITPWPHADSTCAQAYRDDLSGSFLRPQPADG